MKIIRFNNFVLILSLILLIFGCNLNRDCEGCGDCKYENFAENFLIKRIDKSIDTNYKIQFVNTENPEFEFELNQSYIKVSLPVFDDSIMQNQNQVYRIKGNRIISGTCAPENIHEIELKNGAQQKLKNRT
tara:strand:+ start:221 stop:613 length:393 start_codon:yes stop_codon:yes gene_type:complete